MWEIANPVWFPVQFVLFALLVLVPGTVLALLALAGKKVLDAEVALLSLTLGLVAAPLVAFLLVAFTGRPLALWMLATPALLIVAAAGPLVWKGRRPVEISWSRWLWPTLAGVAVVIFLTHNAGLLLTTLFHWVTNAEGNCFRQGTFQYLGIPSTGLVKPMPPAGMAWDGVMRGNVALTSAYLYCFGMPGFRLLRVTNALLLGLLGYVLGHHFSGRRSGAAVGLLLFALNPYVVMVQETDRNLLALAFAGILFAVQARRLLPFWAVGVLAGFTTGLGLQLVPVIYILPLAVGYLQDDRRAWWRWGGVVVIGVAVSAVWLLGIGLYTQINLSDVYTYDMGFFELKTPYALGFPFVNSFYRIVDGQYPAGLTFALHVLETFGTILVGLSLVGWVCMWFRHRAAHHVLLLFGLPLALGLSLLTSLVEDQLRLIIGAFLPLLVFGMVGIQWVAFGSASWKLRGALAAGALLLVFGLGSLAGHGEFPEPNYFPPLVEAGEEGTLKIVDDDPILPYLTAGAIARREAGKMSPHALANQVPRCLSEPRLKCWDYRYPALLPDYRYPHPISRPANVIHGRWLDYTMPNPMDYTTKAAWQGRVDDAIWNFW